VVPIGEAATREIDLIIDLSHGAKALALAESAPHGLWRLSAFEDTAGLAEAWERTPVTRVTLSHHAPGIEPAVIAEAAYNTKFLATWNATFIREKSVQLALRELARVAQGASRQVVPDTPPSPAPRVGGVIPYLFRTGADLSARGLRAFAARLGRRPGLFFLRVGHGDVLDFDPAAGSDIMPGGNSFWADPFLFEHGGAVHVFYEDYDYAKRHGHLSVGRLEGNRMVPLGRVLGAPHHLSFPFVFAHGDEIYMIPETQAAARIEVWRATDFPLSWERVATTLDGVRAADTVAFENDGQWWLFTNICRDSFGDFCSELHLFRVDGPLLQSPEPHPLNPVVIDSRTARGGGRVFARNGRLYRLSQDNSHGIYGYGLNVMEITALTPTEYSEERVRHITPDFAPGIMGCHHFDAAGGRFVLDVRRRYIGA
jgi:hypothetical protein